MTKLLSFTLEQYAKHGINPVPTTAREDSIASRRAIEEAGGILENIVDLEDGHHLAYCWITLDLENSD